MIEIASQQLAINVFRKHIECLLSDKKLADALSFMKEHEFTQVVVRTRYGSGDVRLLTTVGILAWLTDELGNDGCGRASTIDDALHYEPEETTRIMGPNHTPKDVRNAFKESAATPGLFAVIVTDSGLPTGNPIGIATPWDFRLTHSDDFRSVTLGTRQFTLTEGGALAAKVLYKAYQNGTPELGEKLILRKIGRPSTSRLKDSFRNEGWGTLVIPGRCRGTYRLDL